MKKLFCMIVAVVFVLMVSVPAYAMSVEVYGTREITEDLLVNRTNDQLIIERVVGIVLDDELNGRIVNTDEEYYNYISYYGVDAGPGDVVVSYLFYNPETKYTDDVIFRYDIVVFCVHTDAERFSPRKETR